MICECAVEGCLVDVAGNENSRAWLGLDVRVMLYHRNLSVLRSLKTGTAELRLVTEGV